MKTILLYGFLGKQFGKVHHYDVRDTAEAVRAMCVTLNGFRKAVAEGGAFRVLVGGRYALDKDRLSDPVSDKESIRIVPVVAGAGRGVGQTILGVVLIAVGVATGQAWLTNIGVALTLGGVSQMLFSPKAQDPGGNERPENRPSFSFDGAINTTAQGNPVPILYGGPLIVGSQVVSAGLSVEQI